jgi:hypothetical protein
MVPAKFYVFIFIIALLLLPAILSFPFQSMEGFSNFYCGLMTLNVLVLAFVWVYNSSPRLSFPKGLEIISEANMSGCANLTMTYLIPILFIVYFVALINAVVGLVKGKKYTERKWIEEVSKYEVLGVRRR